MVVVLAALAGPTWLAIFCGMYSLTRREQTLVAFVLLAFCVGLASNTGAVSRALAPLQAGLELQQ